MCPLEEGGEPYFSEAWPWGGADLSPPNKEDTEGMPWCNMQKQSHSEAAASIIKVEGRQVVMLSLIKLFQDLLLVWSQHLKTRRAGKMVRRYKSLPAVKDMVVTEAPQ